jgi:hypothetical protein
MNAKTYCPLGKIDCTNFGMVDSCSVKCGDVYYNPTYIEVCPCPSKQQKIERYDMCEDQPAQIDCNHTGCAWHEYRTELCGKCKNISPAIIVYQNYAADCKSFKYR